VQGSHRKILLEFSEHSESLSESPCQLIPARTTSIRVKAARGNEFHNSVLVWHFSEFGADLKANAASRLATIEHDKGIRLRCPYKLLL
jgi:hypothetical protein